jgi:fermentation-respiration switch protein FrsA (DUF1100 family)
VVRSKYADAERPPVLVYGRSLGGAVAIACALDKPVHGIIVEAAFTSVPDMARDMYFLPGVRFIIGTRYNVVEKIQKLETPLLLAHSRDDDIIPFHHGQALYRRAGSSEKEFVELRGGHNESGWWNTPAYWNALTSFVHRTLSSAGTPPSG